MTARTVAITVMAAAVLRLLESAMCLQISWHRLVMLLPLVHAVVVLSPTAMRRERQGRRRFGVATQAMDRILTGITTESAVSPIAVDKHNELVRPRGLIFVLAALLLTVALAGCGGGGGRYADYDDYASSAAEADGESAEEAAEVAAEEARQEAYTLAGASSDGTGSDPSNVSAYDIEQPAFDYCTDDCSGHEAGFEWARDNEVTDESECGGNSQSFHDGCLQFAEERQEQADTDTQHAAEQAAIEAGEATEYEAPEDDTDYDDARVLDGRY